MPRRLWDLHPESRILPDLPKWVLHDPVHEMRQLQKVLIFDRTWLPILCNWFNPQPSPLGHLNPGLPISCQPHSPPEKTILLFHKHQDRRPECHHKHLNIRLRFPPQRSNHPNKLHSLHQLCQSFILLGGPYHQVSDHLRPATLSNRSKIWLCHRKLP
jgi:hypothetical protein